MVKSDPNETFTEQRLRMYAQELNNLHEQQRQQLLEMQRLYDEMQAKEDQRRYLLAQLLTAQEQERKRIAHDIHDGPLQDLGVLLLAIERCKRLIEAGTIGEAVTTLTDLRQEAQQAIGALRTLVSDLRPVVLDTYGLLGAIDFLAERLGRETAITVNVSSQIGSRLERSLEVVVFRLVQEALTNIRKHAQAQHAWVILRREGDDLRLEVRDDGQGFSLPGSVEQARTTGHIGLASMAERAAIAGGHLSIDSNPDQGTVIRVVLPFRSAADSEREPRDPVARAAG